MTDTELLTAYATRQDDAAFSELTRRHGSLVYRACVRMLKDPHQAEDAYQAVFVVLARKAGSLRPGDLAAWLYRVAHHVAAKAVRSRMRQASREVAYVESQALQGGPSPADGAADTAAILARLDWALLRLPERQRQAVILRYLQNHSEKEAARRAGCPVGTLSRRASDGIARLRRSLTALGAPVGLSTLTGMLAIEASSPVPTALAAAVLTTVKASASTAAPAGSGQVLWLAKGALRTLFWAKVRTAAAVVVLTAGLAAVAGVVAHQTLANRAAPPRAMTAAGVTATRTPAAAWGAELLRRAAAAPWDTVDFGQCSARDREAVWLLDNRPGAERRIWQTNAATTSHLYFDMARWRRGVLVGRLLLLPDGELPAPLVAPPTAVRVPVLLRPGLSRDLQARSASQRPGAGAGIYRGDRTQPLNLDSAFPPVVPGDRRAGWVQCLLYFDADTPDGMLLVSTSWPEENPPPPADWHWSVGWGDARVSGADVGLALIAHQASALWQGLKFVPLGADMPPPPPELQRTKNP